jgi:hypothetical protein
MLFLLIVICAIAVNMFGDGSAAAYFIVLAALMLLALVYSKKSERRDVERRGALEELGLSLGPDSWLAWLWFILSSTVGFGIFFGIDALVGHFQHPELGLIEAAMKVPFGGVLTVLGFAACMVFGLSGFCLSLLLALYRRLLGNKFG